MSRSYSSPDALGAALMAATMLDAGVDVYRGRGLSAAGTMVGLAQTATVMEMNRFVDTMRDGPVDMQRLESFLPTYNTIGQVSHTFNSAQDAVDLTNPSRWNIMTTPLQAYNLYSYAEGSLGALGNLPAVEGIPNFLRNLTSRHHT